MTGTPGTSTFSFAGGYLAAGAECTLTLDVTMTVNGNRTNTIPANAVTSTNGAKNKTPAAASLTNLAGASVAKGFSPGEIAAGLGNYSILTITIRTTATVSLTQLGLVDNLPAGLQVAGGSAPLPTNGCGGTLSAAPGATTIQLSGGTLPVGFSNCSMTIPVTGATPGLYTNRIPHDTLTNNEGYSNKEDAVADLLLTPYSLGNRVWYDTNNDGLLNGSETGISGVRVSLYRDNGGTPGVFDAGDTFIGFKTTDANGYYRFDNLDVGTYIVAIGAENFRDIGPGDTVPGNPLANYFSSGTSVVGGVPTDSFGPNPDTNQTDSDDNGVTTFSGGAVDYVSAQAVTIGIGLQPLGETEPTPNPLPGEAPDAQNNRTVDFGFYRSQFGKNLISTDADHTTDTNVAIGEIVTYEVNTNLGAGANLTNVVLTDQLQKGLAYVDCLAVVVGAVDRTAEICGPTPTNPPVVSAITDPGDSATNPANNGRQVVFNLGNVSNPGGDSTMRIRYRAVVLDVAENQKDSELHNTAAWTWVGSSTSMEGPHLKVVEPQMSITKSASPPTADVGSAVTFTLNIAHTASSNSNSFDVVVTDVFPPGLGYIDGSAASTGLAPTSFSYDSATKTLRFIWDVFPLGQTSTITFQATFLGPPPVTNEADAVWTSLPLDPLPSGTPVQLSTFNDHSTERRYDPTDSAGVNNYRALASVTLGTPSSGERRGRGGGGGGVSATFLPFTGFAPGVITSIPLQPVNVYDTSSGISLEIPVLGINSTIVGVPQSGNTWDVTWLGDQVGYLDGTAFPTWSGNSVLTGHVYLSDGLPGPFINLDTLQYGDHVIVHLAGQSYIYEVRSDTVISPDDTSVFKHEDNPWITLITCKDYDAASNTYLYRVAVRAVLIRIESDSAPDSSGGIP
jgi:LPXTG-site transpeptidase (sortase) family protein